MMLKLMNVGSYFQAQGPVYAVPIINHSKAVC
jgi:hypothetical protein